MYIFGIIRKMIVSPCISICKTDPLTGYCYGCGRNDDSVDNGKHKMYEIVEEFAESNQDFIDAFVPAFQIMISNGYDEADLEISSDGTPADNWRVEQPPPVICE